MYDLIKKASLLVSCMIALSTAPALGSEGGESSGGGEDAPAEGKYWSCELAAGEEGKPTDVQLYTQASLEFPKARGYLSFEGDGRQDGLDGFIGAEVSPKIRVVNGVRELSYRWGGYFTIPMEGHPGKFHFLKGILYARFVMKPFHPSKEDGKVQEGRSASYPASVEYVNPVTGGKKSHEFKCTIEDASERGAR